VLVEGIDVEIVKERGEDVFIVLGDVVT